MRQGRKAGESAAGATVRGRRGETGRVLEVLGSDRWSTTRLVREAGGRTRVEREFTALPPSFAATLPYVFSLQRSLRLAGLVRPDALLDAGGRPVWCHGPVRARRLSHAELGPAEALAFAAGLVNLLGELHARSIFGVELGVERLFVAAGGRPLFSGLILHPGLWGGLSGLDALRIEEVDTRVDLPALGEVFSGVAARIRPGDVAAAETLRELGRRLALAEPAARPSLGETGRIVLEAGAPPVRVAARGGPPPTPALAGREPLLREIEVLLGRALGEAGVGGRRPRLVAIAGRPGVGKTRVLSALGSHARDRGVVVLAARSRPNDRRLLGPLEDVLAALSEAGGTVEPEPEPASATLTPMAERRRRVELATRALLSGIRSRPCLVLLEDIDLLPAPAVEALSYVVRDLALEEPEAVRLALVVTLRPAEDPDAQSPAARTIEDLREEGFAERVRLPALDAEAARELLGSLGVLDPEDVERIAARGAGNPRLLDELTRLASDSPREALPGSVAEAFRRRLKLCGAAERRLVEALAILGGEAALGLAAALLPARERPQVLGTMLRLVARRLLKAVGGPALALANRDAVSWVVERIPAGRARSLHRLAGRAIEAGGGPADPQVLAWHYEQCGERARFLEHGSRAAQILASTHANELALELYGKLLAVVPARDVVVRLDLLERLAALRALVGDFAGAAAAYREILALPHDPARTWQFWKALGEALRDGEDYPAAAEAFDRGLLTLGPEQNLAVADLLSEKAPILARMGEIDTARGLAEMAGSLAQGLPESRELAEVRNRLGATLKFVGDYERAVRHIEAGLRISEEVGAWDLAAIALNNLATFLSVHGERQRAIELCLRSLEIHQKLGDVSAIATTAVNVGALYLRSYDLEHARRYLEMGLRMARRFGKSFIVSACLSNLAELNFQRARYGEAIEGRQRALRIAERLGRRAEYAGHLIGLALVYAALGSAAETGRVARRLAQLAAERDDPRLVGLARIGAGEALRLEGRFDEARAELTHAEAVFRDIAASDHLVLALLSRAELELAAGATSAALTAAGEAEAVGATAGLHPERALALLLVAEALLADEPGGAERSVREAEGIAGELDQPELRWRTEYLSGELALRKGDRIGAARRFAAARELLDQIAENIGDKELAWSYMRERRRVALLRRARENPFTS